jgi:hypothetical protein
MLFIESLLSLLLKKMYWNAGYRIILSYRSSNSRVKNLYYRRGFGSTLTNMLLYENDQPPF